MLHHDDCCNLCETNKTEKEKEEERDTNNNSTLLCYCCCCWFFLIIIIIHSNSKWLSSPTSSRNHVKYEMVKHRASSRLGHISLLFPFRLTTKLIFFILSDTKHHNMTPKFLSPHSHKQTHTHTHPNTHTRTRKNTLLIVSSFVSLSHLSNALFVFILSVLLPPSATLWANAENSRWSIKYCSNNKSNVNVQ